MHRNRTTPLTASAAVVLVVSLTGCASSSVQLWANSSVVDPKDYTRSNPQNVHVGETTQFRVVVEPDVASYVMIDFAGESYLLEKGGAGLYAFNRQFTETWRDRSVQIEARAFRQHGQPDYALINGKVARSSKPTDPSDEFLGTSTMTVECYQSTVIMHVGLASEPDWTQGVLEIFGPGGKITKIGLASRGRRGFIVAGKSASTGTYVVFYEPAASEIFRTGRTRAVFGIPDARGQINQWETWFDTP